MDPLLLRLADSLTPGQSLEALTRPLLEMLETVTGLESTYLTTVDLAAGTQYILYARNTHALEIPEGLAVPWGDTLCKRALDEGVPYADDVAARWGDSDAAQALGIATYVSTPVRIGEGQLFGTLCAASASRVALAPAAQKVLAMFSQLIGQQVEREQLMSQLRNANAELAASALFDPVTGVANRRHLTIELERMLARATRDGSGVVVAFLDLDGFKAVNDRHGHDVGDQLLAAVATRLRTALRAGDFLARVGGDEFVVLAPTSRAGAAAAASALRDALVARSCAGYTLGGIEVDYCGASVGTAIGGDDPDEGDALLRRADADMYRAKRARRVALP